MPIYEYRCTECSKITSVFTRKVGAASSATCDACGSTKTERAISNFAFAKSSSGDGGFGDMGDFGGDDMGMGGMGGMPGMGGMGGMGGMPGMGGMGGMGGFDMGDDF